MPVAIVASVGFADRAQAVVQLAEENKKTKTAQAKAEKEKNRALREFELAEANLDMAIKAFEEIVNDLSKRGVPNSLDLVGNGDHDFAHLAIVTPADAEVLCRLLTFFDEFSKNNDADLRRQRAKAIACVGDIQRRLHQPELSESAYRDPEKRRILDIVGLNYRLDGSNLSIDVRKPFDVLIEGVKKKVSRADWIRTSDLYTPSGNLKLKKRSFPSQSCDFRSNTSTQPPHFVHVSCIVSCTILAVTLGMLTSKQQGGGCRNCVYLIANNTK